MLSSNPLVEQSPRHRVVKRNVICVYCARPFSAELPWEEEHVVGRRFVPKGTLSGNWNLIVRACGVCNDGKADLENDISAITMQPDATRSFASDDPRLASEASRKGRTTNRRTGRFVEEVEKPPNITMNAPGFSVSFGFVQPAQADPERLFLLARLQLMGFFFMLTYDEGARRGHYWPGDYQPVVAVRKEDWGHPHLQWIEELSRDWNPRLHAVTAEGFYKIWIKRRPNNPAIWSWALEWNRTYRVAGFFGEKEALDKVMAGLPESGMRTLHERGEHRVRLRREVPLPEDKDTLFAWSGGEEG